jgi:hypothetical protein
VCESIGGPVDTLRLLLLGVGSPAMTFSPVAAVRFRDADAAQACVKALDGRAFQGRSVRCQVWDGRPRDTVMFSYSEGYLVHV